MLRQKKKHSKKKEDEHAFEIISHVHFTNWSPILAYQYLSGLFDIDNVYTRICGPRYQILPISIHIMISHMSTYGILKSKYNTQPYLIIEPLDKPGTIQIYINDPRRQDAWTDGIDNTRIVYTQDLPTAKNAILFATHGAYEYMDGTSVDIKDIIKTFNEIYYIKPYTEQGETITHVCSVRPDLTQAKTIILSQKHIRNKSSSYSANTNTDIHTVQKLEDHTKCMFLHFSTYELLYIQFWNSQLNFTDPDLLVRMADCHFRNTIAMRACAWKLFALNIPYNNSRANVCGGAIWTPNSIVSQVRVLAKYQNVHVIGTKMIMFSVRCDSERIQSSHL
jgi:hypothetical protein